MAPSPVAKPQPAVSSGAWEAWAQELADLRSECQQLGDIFEGVWAEMDQLRSDLAARTEQHEQLRTLVQEQQRLLVTRNDQLQQSVARMEERQQQFSEIFSDLLTLREDRRRKS